MLRDKALIFRLVRFGLAGLASTLFYGLLALALVHATSLEHMTIHVLAFAVALPLSYLLQKTFTFRYRGEDRKAIPRFIVASTAAFAASTFAVYLLVDMWQMPYTLGIAAVMVIVPLASFLSMQFWVFFSR